MKIMNKADWGCSTSKTDKHDQLDSNIWVKARGVNNMCVPGPVHQTKQFTFYYFLIILIKTKKK